VTAVKLRELLEATTKAGEQAVETFEGLGMRGFEVGTAVFERDSPDLTRGRRLASILDRTLSPDPTHPPLTGSISELVRTLRLEVVHARRLD
jgi:hypothetical protein